MDDAVRVGGGEPFGHLGGDPHRLPDGKRPARQDLPQALPLDQLHDDEAPVLRLPHLVDDDDRRVVQGRRGPRLLLEPRKELRVAGDPLREDLQRDVPREARVAGPVDLAHPPRPQGGHDLVRTQALAGLEHPPGAF